MDGPENGQEDFQKEKRIKFSDVVEVKRDERRLEKYSNVLFYFKYEVSDLLDTARFFLDAQSMSVEGLN